MFCNKCGHQVEDGSTFCVNCGARIVYMDQTINQSSDICQTDQSSEKEQPNKIKGLIIGLSSFLCIILVTVGIIFWFSSKKNKSALTNDSCENQEYTVRGCATDNNSIIFSSDEVLEIDGDYVDGIITPDKEVVLECKDGKLEIYNFGDYDKTKYTLDVNECYYNGIVVRFFENSDIAGMCSGEIYNPITGNTFSFPDLNVYENKDRIFYDEDRLELGDIIVDGDNIILYSYIDIDTNTQQSYRSLYVYNKNSDSFEKICNEEMFNESVQFELLDISEDGKKAIYKEQLQEGVDSDNVMFYVFENGKWNHFYTYDKDGGMFDAFDGGFFDDDKKIYLNRRCDFVEDNADSYVETVLFNEEYNELIYNNTIKEVKTIKDRHLGFSEDWTYRVNNGFILIANDALCLLQDGNKLTVLCDDCSDFFFDSGNIYYLHGDKLCCGDINIDKLTNETVIEKEVFMFRRFFNTSLVACVCTDENNVRLIDYKKKECVEDFDFNFYIHSFVTLDSKRIIYYSKDAEYIEYNIEKDESNVLYSSDTFKSFRTIYGVEAYANDPIQVEEVDGKLKYKLLYQDDFFREEEY